ncbi:MAG: hypothetical protein QM482_01330 [Sulfurospirillum sp.]
MSFILLAGALICYKNYKFEGIGKKELDKKYILKSSVKFKDLPTNEQKKYICKKSLSYSEKPLIDFSDKSIDQSNINSVKKLRKIIKSLKSKISIIQNDNIQLSNDKEDMQKIVEKMKIEFKKQRDKLLKQNMQQINDTEQQHYKNISELTTKINDLQRENIKLSKDNNIEIIALKAKINILNDKLSKLNKKKIKKV